MPNQKKPSHGIDQRSINYGIEPFQDYEVDDTKQELLRISVEEALQEDLFESKFNLGEKQKYQGSDEQIKIYESIGQKDTSFKLFVIKTYGSYENFLRANDVLRSQFAIFDPRKDFKAEVSIITEDKFFKADHISSIELIMEALYGRCTVDYIDRNGRSHKIFGTLNKNLIPQSKMAERINFFSPLKNNRIVLFNLIKGDWSSFFMGGLIRFVRDDTVGIE